MNLWDFLWSTFLIFAFVAYLIILFSICADLFRDRGLAGGYKALWIIFLIVLPYLAAFVYLIARGRGMAERNAAARGGGVPEADDYRPSASSTPAADIAQAKALLDAGTITQGEYDALKSKALGNQYFGA